MAEVLGTTDIKSYGLPIKRVEDTKNYFPVHKEQFLSLETIRQGDESGTTQTSTKKELNK